MMDPEMPTELNQQMEIAGGNSHALLMLDREMGARVFAIPASAPYYPSRGRRQAPNPFFNQ